MNIETFCPGMTVLPDQIDEATGKRSEGSAEVVDTKHGAFHNQAHETQFENIYKMTSNMEPSSGYDFAEPTSCRRHSDGPTTIRDEPTIRCAEELKTGFTAGT